MSLLPVACKVLEKIVQQQLFQYFARFPEVEALPTEQFAYRQNHSCTDLLVYAISIWSTGLEKDLFCGVLFCDMSKAFDRVQHVNLLAELAAVGIGGLVLAWFSDYLSQRTQQVIIRATKGDVLPSTWGRGRGVPQGSVLDPLLFCIYVRYAHGSH